MLKIILFGGSFDPINNYHIHIAQKAAQQVNADIVVLMPSYYGRYGQFHSASPKDRLNMCKLGIPKTLKPKYVVSDYELKLREESSPYDSLIYLEEIYPDAELFLLLGSDNLMTFSEWKNAALIKSKAKIICYLHPDFAYTELGFFARDGVIYLKDKSFFRSSEDVRLKPKFKELPTPVLEYINTYGIYATNRLKEMLSQERFDHTLRVANTAVRLAKTIAKQFYNSPEEINQLIIDAYVAGLYHDICKELKKGELIHITKEVLKIPQYPSWQVLHGPVGAWWVKSKYFLNNPRVLRAIAEHTCPKPDAPLLSQIIYLADHLEPKRLEFMGEKKYDYYWNLINNNKFEQAFEELKTSINEKFSDDECDFNYNVNY